MFVVKNNVSDVFEVICDSVVKVDRSIFASF